MTKYRLTESARDKYLFALGVLTLTGLMPMLIAGLLFEMLGL